jgi:endonuclease III
MVEADTTEIEKLIHPASFYRTKAKHIQSTSKILIDNYSSDIPKSVEELCKLPGVGPKVSVLSIIYE